MLLITFLAPLVAKFALKFGPPEFFAVYLLTFCSFVGTGKDPFKTIIAMMLGFGLAAIGMDTVSGELRMTFGWSELLRGVDFLIVVIGLFGVGEILISMEEGLAFEGKSGKINPKVVLETWKKLPRYWLTLDPQLGHRLLDGDHARRRHRRLVHGLRHCQALFPGRRQVRHRAAGRRDRPGNRRARLRHCSALLPMLALGIPGSATAAVLLGGLMIWGLQPGPLLFVEQKDFVWGLIASMYLSNIAGLIIVLTTVPLFAAILRIPFSIIAPIIIVVCAIGAYTVHSAMLDIWFMVLFGVIGYVLKKLDYPLAPLVLSLVLGDRAENAFRQTMLGSKGDLADLLVQLAGRHHHDARAYHAVLAADCSGVAQTAPGAGGWQIRATRHATGRKVTDLLNACGMLDDRRARRDYLGPGSRNRRFHRVAH